MRLYERHILPRIIDAACSVAPIRKRRESILRLATGEVLDIGFGTGLNLPAYHPFSVRRVLALEPSLEMWSLAAPRVAVSPFPVEHLHTTAEEMALAGQSVDTAVVAFALCTIADVPRALQQVRRVLRPGGKLLFVEHGASPDSRVFEWQNRINPIWRRLAGGCNLIRPIPRLLEENGFTIESLESEYVDGWKIDSFLYSGVAVPIR